MLKTVDLDQNIASGSTSLPMPPASKPMVSSDEEDWPTLPMPKRRRRQAPKKAVSPFVAPKDDEDTDEFSSKQDSFPSL